MLILVAALMMPVQSNRDVCQNIVLEENPNQDMCMVAGPPPPTGPGPSPTDPRVNCPAGPGNCAARTEVDPDSDLVALLQQPE
jgi:hypothetical protein